MHLSLTPPAGLDSPKRWMSVREQKEHDPVLRQDFDFAFSVQGSDTSLEHVRPTTSAGDSRINKKLRLDIQSPIIGVALGSPRHPTPSPDLLTLITPPASPDHAFRHEGPFSVNSTHNPRWKKLGGIFKSKQNNMVMSDASPVRYQRNTADLSATDKPNMTLDHKSPNSVSSTFVTTPSLSSSRNGNMNQCNVGHLPKLELEIPTTPLERYSVMFRDVKGAPTIMSRRSKTLDDLVTVSTQSESLASPKSPPSAITRRVTSPTFSKRPTFLYLKPGASTSKYSLFPTDTTNYRSGGPRPSPKPRGRSATAPSQPSPKHDVFIRKNSSPLKHRTDAEVFVTSPGDTTASTDPGDMPWRSVDSVPTIPSSRTSIDEIFFDIKPIRDSKGVEDHQFVMTRPESSEVQLARSKSQARRQLRGQSNQNIDEDQSERTTPSKTSLEIDEAIAAVERLTSSALANVTSHHNSRSRSLSRNPNTSNHSEGMTITTTVRPTPLSTLKLRKTGKTRVVGTGTGMPSPVVEQAEEPSPIVKNCTAKSAATTPSPCLLTNSKHVAASAIPKYPSPPISPPRLKSTRQLPPPVPPKDSKFIPISRYAAKNTAAKVTECSGLRPTRSPRPTKTQPTPISNFEQHSASKPFINTYPPDTVFAYIQPNPEVSVARKVSLSRRPSARILVSRPSIRDTDHRNPSTPILERSVAGLTPMIHEAHLSHKPGVSMNLIVETASIHSA